MRLLKKPHIIYILADDMGYGDLSCLNPACAWETPHFDRLARGGMAFTDAHSSSAVCTPSRYSILTGRYSWRSALRQGVTWGTSRPLIEPKRTTVASYLKKEGYHTACFGKWHLGWDWGTKDHGIGPESLVAKHGEVAAMEMADIDFAAPISGGPLDHGFDEFFGIAASLDMPPYVYVQNRTPTAIPNEHFAGEKGKRMARPGPIAPDFSHDEVLPKLTEKICRHVENIAKDDRPHFVYFPLPAPHTPILPGKPFRGKSKTNAYGDFVLMCDDVVGQVMNQLEKAGISENTLLVYTSDNGCSPMADFPELAAFGHNPSHVFRGHKADIFEGGHRVPFLAQWPAVIGAGQVCHETTCLSDLLATTADIMGTPLASEEGEDSVSALPLFQNLNPASYKREATVHHSINGSFSIRRGNWKLEFCPDSGGWSFPKPGIDDTSQLPPLQLYHLGDDLGERHNRAGEEPAMVRELTGLLLRYIRDGRSTPGLPQPNTGSMDLELESILNPGKSRFRTG